MKRLIYIILTASGLFLCLNLTAQEKTYNAGHLNPTPPTINGLFNDEAWQKVSWQDDFTQREPYEGKKPSQKTVFKILYDNDFLYLAIRAYDSHPDSIVERLSRRDNRQGDNIGVHIDSYNDNRTAFVFNVSAAGVKSDWITSDDGDNQDDNWDPIWYVETKTDSLGWTAEIKIPFTQLRFSKKGSQNWGLQIRRNIYRYDEEVHWKLIPKDAGGWVSRFGELTGMDHIEPQKEKSITPYTVTEMETFKEVPENPFKTSGRSSKLNAGLNGKIGITNNLTLDMAINPDFGQVEADPSQVNLTAYETYFEEKRPFFIEGSSIMNFRVMPVGNFMNDNLFYSRRIGRTPHHYPDTENEEYVKRPDNTTILGAFKLTGKSKNGWSIGILESMTEREQAKISDGNNSYHEPVEPLANYFLGRVQKDFNEGNTILGGMLTATNRKIDSKQLEFLHDQAYTGGINFKHQWQDKKYTLTARGIFSHLRGDEEAILRTQTASARYYQRPDADYVTLDSSRRSLTGHGGSLMFAKFGKGNFQYGAFLNWKSPGLELNDMGYQRDADQLSEIAFVTYRSLEPFSIFRSFRASVNQWQIWDYGGNSMVTGGNINVNVDFKNYWEFGFGVNGGASSLSKTALRGGPYLRTPANLNYWWSVNSDHRKDFRISAGNNQEWSKYGHAHDNVFWANISYRPMNTLDISLNPSVSFSQNKLQYISTEEFREQNRYIMGSIERTTVSMSLRMSLSLTPELSIQYWGQPFIATGDYNNLKRIKNSTAADYKNRFHTFEEDQVHYVEGDEFYEIDENRDGEVDYSIGDPNFKAFQFKSNLVARWQYRPGSTIYLVWSQNRDKYISDGAFRMQQDFNRLSRIFPHNIFLVKMTYRLGL
ncbi:MAG: carbohydrate binding family 9 domain-containing protein [Bacteroidales bacterium]|nr:carbohydrate binding family 9 domain-containing protein [Bacteroidales bacterium]MCF8336948.1 carbohydrate binding family 9 domain-containing protein [Bacteroidales bacterium]